MSVETQTKDEMDRMYRWTRHIYDASRKYYLLGRDILLKNITPKDGDHICEIGCGTARNLRKLAKRYPNVEFYGLDASGEMLKTARKKVPGTVKLAQGYAQSFSPEQLFGLNVPFEKIIFSYCLSIIPPWKESIDHALSLLEIGGELHVVDFGAQKGLPSWFRNFLFWWLDKFHVYHKPEILEYLQTLEHQGKGALKLRHLYRGYAWYAVFKKS